MYTGYPLHWREFGRVPLMCIVVERKPVMASSRWRSPWWSTIASIMSCCMYCCIMADGTFSNQWKRDWFICVVNINTQALPEVPRIFTSFGDKVGNSALVCGISNMTVLLKNLFTVHILIWHTQIRSQHYLWWQNSAFMDTARRSATSALLRRCCGDEPRWIYIPIRCPWMQFEQVSPPPPQNPKWVTTQHTISSRRGDAMPVGNCFPSLDKGFGSLPHFVSSTFF